MPNYKIHQNPVRNEWLEKIAALENVKDATAFLQDFRMKYTTPLRTSYELDVDYLFIEAKAEERLSLLKVAAFSNEDLLSMATTGETAADVAQAWMPKLESEKCKFTGERIHMEFRQLYKPPVLPVNVFLKIDSYLGSRLMELRNSNYYDCSLDELREQRGVKVLMLGDAA
ncbi:methane monooxygenase [Methyloceanibacter methanicus]|uniref:Methane monooxygenase n=1 Tax=Methyloceanibacter methanicus TaxID=1774968 RepID=A0A1E3W2S2_9HYPH|nr:methane monooxygenase [Methyloceanibacter methanicus]ODS00096.1 methane monooxygenase [Methyloceanibacter methanicus]